MKLFTRFKKSVAGSVYSKVLKDPKVLLFQLGLDVLFLVVAFFVLSFVASMSPLFAGSIIMALPFVFFYCLVGVLIYSLFKWYLLSYLFAKLDLKKSERSFVSFLKLNVVLFLAFGALLLVLSSIAQSFREPLSVILSGVLMLLFFVLVYVFILHNHVLFLFSKNGMGLHASLLHFLHPKRWYFFALVVIVLFIPVILLFLIIGNVLTFSAFKDPFLFSKYSNAYNMTFSVVSIIAFYLGLGFNRMYQLVLMEKVK